MLFYWYLYYQSCYILTTIAKNILKISYVLDYLRAKLHASDNSFIVLACDIESHRLIIMNALIRF